MQNIPNITSRTPRVAPCMVAPSCIPARRGMRGSTP